MKYEQTWDVLETALQTITYKDGSRFALNRDDESNWARLDFFMHLPNAFRDDRADRYTRFEFLVPIATYDQENWTRWVFVCIKGVEIHEICEWFRVNGERPYAPHHGNGEDPYVEWHPSDPERAAKSPGDD